MFHYVGSSIEWHLKQFIDELCYVNYLLSIILSIKGWS